MIVYLATNRVNGKRYVGQTVGTLSRRKRSHKRSSEKGDGYLFHRAIRKYGFDAFEWEVLSSGLSPSEADEEERAWIKFCRSKVPGGYNLTDGGGGTVGFKQSAETVRKRLESRGKVVVSPETRAILSQTIKTLWQDPAYRSHVVQSQKEREPISEVTRQKLSVASKIRWEDPEYRQRIVEANVGKVLSPEHRRKLAESNRGKPHKPLSEEACRKISKANTGRSVPAERRKKISTTLQGHEVSEETRQKIRVSLTGRKNPEHSARMTGRTQTEESNKKRSESMRAYRAKQRAEREAGQSGAPVRTLPA